MASGISKAKGRRQSKNKLYYSSQKHRTRTNKMKKILRSSGQKALDLWVKEHTISTSF